MTSAEERIASGLGTLVTTAITMKTIGLIMPKKKRKKKY
jgi:hypothetical protein